MRVPIVFALIACVVAYPKVGVQFYEEAGCPDCQAFIQGDLNTTFSAQGLSDIIDLQIYPWGNAYHNISACSSPYYGVPLCVRVYLW